MKLESKLKKSIEEKDINKIESVFEEIYNTYFNLVCFIIYKYIKRKEDIEDIATDVFINFFNRLNEIDFKNIKYYLVASANNLAINFIKSKKNRVDFIEREEIDDMVESPNSSSLVDELKEELTESDFYILYERIVNERSFKAISLDLNISYEATKKRYQRIIKKLRSKH